MSSAPKRNTKNIWEEPERLFLPPSAMSRSHLGSASLHLGRGIRRMESVPRGGGKCKHFPPPLVPLFRAAHCYTKKNRRPRGSSVHENSDFKCAIRGSNPGHPD